MSDPAPTRARFMPMLCSVTKSPVERFFGNRLFEGIDRRVLEDILTGMDIRSFDRDQIIFREGDSGDLLYLVGEGSVKISKRGRGGNEEALGYIESGDFFGEMALLDGEARSATAAAARPSILGVINESAFQCILEHAPSRLHLNFLRSVAARLRKVNSHFIHELMRSERLSMVGSMASMILHDLNNLISTVHTCCAVIGGESDNETICEATKLIEGAVGGMLAMTQELLDFTRGSISLEKRRVKVAELIEKLRSRSLANLTEKSVTLKIEADAALEIEVDENRFLRMLGNLAKNAVEAMPTGGTLILTAEIQADEATLQITDTGVGIPAELLPQIFEPFITHGKANGTGLGMAIAKSVVEAHAGKISIGSKMGAGTTVEIRLPRAAGNQTPNFAAVL